MLKSEGVNPVFDDADGAAPIVSGQCKGVWGELAWGS